MLKDGSWGAAIQGDDVPPDVEVEVGVPLTIRTKNGKEWEAKVEGVVFSSGDFYLVRTQKESGDYRRAPRQTSEAEVVASPSKLQDGDWGASIQVSDIPSGVEIASGLPIRIKARSGKEWDANVYEVLFEGDDYFLVRTKKPASGWQSGEASRDRSNSEWGNSRSRTEDREDPPLPPADFLGDLPF